MPIEGFRPGVTERLGLGPDECVAANPRLVYARITVWGRDGPLAQSAGHDINYLSITGMLDSIRTSEHPSSRSTCCAISAAARCSSSPAFSPRSLSAARPLIATALRQLNRSPRSNDGAAPCNANHFRARAKNY